MTLMIGLPNSILAQDYELKKDSLIQKLSVTEDVEARCKLLKELTALIKRKDPKESVLYGQKLVHEAEKLPNSQTLVKSYVAYGHILFNNGIEMDSVKVLGDESLRVADLLNDDLGKLACYYLLGLYERERGSSELAANYFLDCIKLGEQSNEPSHKLFAARATQGLGVLKDNQGKHHESKELFLKALKLGEELHDNEMRFHARQSLGISEAMDGKLRNGLKHFLDAKPFAEAVSDKSNILSNISYVYSLLGVADSAEIISLEAVQMAKEMGNLRQQVVTLTSLTGFYAAQGMSDKFLETLKQREVLILKLNSKKWNRSNYSDYADYYESVNNSEEALRYFKLYKSANDSVINESSEKAMAEMEKKYESEKNKRQIKEQEVELTKQNEQRKLFLVSFILMALLAGLTYWFMRKRNIKNKTIAEQKAEINRQKIKELQKEKEILGMASMLEGQESERSRIAKDLHDGLGGLLTSVKAHFSMIEGEIKKIESINLYDNAQSMMDNACEEVRRISHNLMPPLLHSQGLPIAISNLVNNINISHKMDVQFEERDMSERLDETKEIFIYRICQELINNVVKHAETEKVEISLYGLPDTVQLIVEDHGKGFNMDDIQDGLGLRSIRSRVDYLKGDMEIDSTIGKGTVVSIIVPV